MNFIKNFEKSNPVIFYFLIFLVLFIFINKISKNFLNQTKLEKKELPGYLERVYGEENVNDYQKVLKEQTIPFDYKPFVDFGEIERSKEFTIVGESGNRCNFNDINKCRNPQGGENEIWIFGGSTTFGYGLKNNETISAHLQNLLQNKYNVINFGSGYYYSTQERIFLNNLLTKIDPPYAVVFIDGLNDFIREFKLDETAFTQSVKYKMGKSSSDDIREYLFERIYRLNVVKLIKQIFFNEDKKIVRNLKDSLGANLNNDLSKTVNILINNQKVNKGVSEIYNFNLLQILQPVPIYKDSYDTSNLPIEYHINNLMDVNFIKLKSSYELYLSNKPTYVLDLSNFKINDPMYIDGAHYSSMFNFGIAEQIKQNLF